jgi:hypothetical protein
MRFRISAQIRAFAVGVAMSLAPNALAYEVDNFTGRDREVSDALPVLDSRVNAILSKAERKANEESPFHCNKVLLRGQILRWVRPDPISFLDVWATITDQIDRIEISKSESVYSGARLTESPAIWFAGIGRSFRLDGRIVGTDKLGHFFMQGFDYFKQSEAGRPIEEVLSSEHGEDGMFGLTTSGVLSYADMSANYAGYRFWRQLYAGESPYFRCEDGKRWRQIRSFTWKDYVSDAWDEAINCSSFRPELGQRVEENLKKHGIRCPISADKCAALAGHDFAQQLISPQCLDAGRAFGEATPKHDPLREARRLEAFSPAPAPILSNAR